MLAVGAIVLVLVGTAGLQRSDERTVDIDPGGPIRIRSTAGPVEVLDEPGPAVSYRASWLIRGPTEVTDAGGLDLRCDTRWPCRALSTVRVPSARSATDRGSAVDLDVHTVDEDVVVTGFVGRLLVTTEGVGAVVLGPVRGEIRAVTAAGTVVGHGVRAEVVEVVTDGGAVELHFAEPPRSAVIEAGTEPVTISLPPGSYAVTVSGTPVDIATDVDVVQAADAEHRLSVRARGPVRIQSST